MTQTRITYDPSKNEAAGYLEIVSGSPPLTENDKKTLLHLLFWLLHTREGRDLLRNNKPPAPGQDDDVVRANLREVFVNQFGILNRTLLDALINAHFAADRWVEANNRMPESAAQRDREHYEKVYQQNISFVMWMLWEDAMGHDFSMSW